MLRRCLASSTAASSIPWHVGKSSTVDRSLLTFGTSALKVSQPVGARLSVSPNRSFTSAEVSI